MAGGTVNIQGPPGASGAGGSGPVANDRFTWAGNFQAAAGVETNLFNAVATTTAGTALEVEFSFSGDFNGTNGNALDIRVYVDGVLIPNFARIQNNTAGGVTLTTTLERFKTGLANATHTVTVSFQSGGSYTQIWTVNPYHFAQLIVRSYA